MLWQVEVMQHELKELQPVLATTAKEVEVMMTTIAADKQEAAVTKAVVEQQEHDANAQAAEAKAIAGACAVSAACSLLPLSPTSSCMADASQLH